MRSIKILKNTKGKIALVRVDFNMKSAKNSIRLPKTLPTIQFLLKKGAKVVLVAHRGRPTKVDKFLSLKLILPFLKKNLRSKVTFLPSFDFKKNKKIIEKGDGVFVLENIRFHKGETKNDKKLAKELASLGDFYVNEAFSNSHRDHASMTGVQKFLPSYAGFLLEQEVKHLKGLKKGLVVILGGGKAKDKFSVIKPLYPKTKRFLLGGVVANTFLKAQGAEIKRSFYEPKIMKDVRKLSKFKKIIIPKDWRVCGRGMIKDIGPITAKEFVKEIKSAKQILWSGPLGMHEDKRFAIGSVAIAKAIAKSKGFSIVGGGETTQLIKSLKLEKKINFLSTGGGAMLAYLAGRRFKAIDMIK